MATIDIIPVIDLKGGRAVRAVGRAGRDRYRPLVSPLCPAGDPLDAVRGYRRLFPFPRFYLADLDAIAGGLPQVRLLARIRRAFPEIKLWVDSGVSTAEGCRCWRTHGLGRLVLGSESLHDASLAACGDGILSLDFRDGRFLGPPSLLDSPALWPDTVIVMTLAQVGSAAGPDWRCLEALRARAPDRRLYAAGGVRDAADLKRLAEMGVAGALVATALHEGTLTAAEIRRLTRA